MQVRNKVEACCMPVSSFTGSEWYIPLWVEMLRLFCLRISHFVILYFAFVFVSFLNLLWLNLYLHLLSTIVCSPVYPGLLYACLPFHGKWVSQHKHKSTENTLLLYKFFIFEYIYMQKKIQTNIRMFLYKKIIRTKIRIYLYPKNDTNEYRNIFV